MEIRNGKMVTRLMGAALGLMLFVPIASAETTTPGCGGVNADCSGTHIQCCEGLSCVNGMLPGTQHCAGTSEKLRK